MSELLPRTSLLLISSPLSVTLESLCSGVKALYLIPEEISFGINSLIRDNAFIAYEDDFSQKLRKALNSLKYSSIKIADCFSRPNYEIFRKYLIMSNS